MLRYPARLERDTNGTILVSFPDVPEAHTFGEDSQRAPVHQQSAGKAVGRVLPRSHRPFHIAIALDHARSHWS